jgi:hypothetical protein
MKISYNILFINNEPIPAKEIPIKHTYHTHKFRVISFFNGASPFSGVCPFHFYDICNEQESDSACVYGKVYAIETPSLL